MRRPCADREEKRVIHGNDTRREEKLDPRNPNQRSLLEFRRGVAGQGHAETWPAASGRRFFLASADGWNRLR